jgi:hypothetical protein
MVVLEKSEAGSRCITNGIFVESKPKLGGTTDVIASSVRPIWDGCCFYLEENEALFNIRWSKYVYHHFSSALKVRSMYDVWLGALKNDAF